MDKNIPNHIAIIPDGNRRWAKEHNLPTLEGHRRGAQVAINVSRKIRKMGVHTLTLWAFSTENWNRPDDEVAYLMVLYEKLLDDNLKEALKDETKITHIGRKDRLSQKLVQKIRDVEEKTKHFSKYQLNIGLDYGGRDEMLRAVKTMASSALDLTKVTEEEVSGFLDTANQLHPNPDIIIRTSGEQRTSGLMIWQAAYAEYFFLEKYFPELKNEDIEKVIEEYGNRQRRFGK